MIRDYPGLKAQWEELHKQAVNVDMAGLPRGSDFNRGTEIVALRELDPDDQKAFEAVSRAVEITKLRRDGEERLSLIRYVYWYDKRHLLKDAAYRLYISETTATEWHGEFVRLVGKCYGFHLS